jgi:hypothetical protein
MAGRIVAAALKRAFDDGIAASRDVHRQLDVAAQ